MLQKKSLSGTTPSKPRVCGSLATSLPPTNAPQWAINPDWGPSPLHLVCYPLEIIVIVMIHTGENFGPNDPESDIDQDGSPVTSGM